MIRRLLGSVHNVSDRVMLTLSFIALCSVVAFLLLMIAFVLRESGVIQGLGISFYDLIVGQPWEPLASPPRYGIFHAWVSTLIVAGLSLSIAVPLGFGIGLFIAEVAPPVMQQILQPAVELLAGIPAVVYGFFGYVVLVRNFEMWFKMPAGECLLIAGLILAVMVLPFIASTAAETFRSVSRELKDTAYCFGVTKLYVMHRVVLQKALPGLFAAVALGLARALGETLAVLMLAGNSSAAPGGLFDRGQPITALLATELGETMVSSQKYKVLFASGFLLLTVVLGINMMIWFLRNRMLARANG